MRLTSVLSVTPVFLGALSVLVTVSAPASAAPAATVLRTAAQEGSSPKFIDGSVATGHCPTMLKAIEAIDPSLSFRIDPAPTAIKRLETELHEGHIDVICALLDTPRRNEIAHRVATPLFHLRERLVGRADDTAQVRDFKALGALGGAVVTQSGASYAALLRSHGVTVLEPGGGSPAALRFVEDRRARFYYINELTGLYYIKALGLSEKLRLMPGVLQETPSYLWVGRHLDSSVIQRLEKAVAALQKNGELDRIYRSYLSGS